MIKKHPYRAAVKHIRQMHHAINWTPNLEEERLVCAVCKVPYPCKTIQVIDDDLYDDSEISSNATEQALENLFEELI